MNPSTRSSLSARALALIALLVALTAVTYAPALDNDFINFDDFVFIRDNPDFNPPDWPAILGYFRGPYFGGAFPLTYVFIGVVAEVAHDGQRLNPGLFHAAGIILHAGCVVLTFLILRLLVRSDVAAAAGAAVFAVHTIQVEAVAWVMNLNTLLSALFSLLAILLYLHYAFHARDDVERTRRRTLFVAATVSLVLAMLARPLAVTVPLVVLALDVGWVGRDWRKTVKPVGLWLALTLPFVVLTQTMIRPPSAIPPPLWARPLVALDAVAFYVWKILVPHNFAPDYGRSPQWLLREGPVAWTWVVPVLTVALVAWFGRRHGWRAAALVVMFVAPMLPVLGLVPSHFQEYSTVADRYAYLPMLAVAIAVAWLAARWRAIAYGVGAVVIVLAILSNRQTARWVDTDTLFGHTLRINPGSIAAHNAIGQAAVQQKRFDTALRHYEAALAAHPENEAAHSNLANLLLLNGRIAEALPHYEIANKARPNRPRIVNNYAVALVKSGRARQAAELLESCIANAAPAIRSELKEYANLHVNLAMILLHFGAVEQAEAHFEQALRIQPDHEWAAQGLDEARRARAGVPTTSPATQSTAATQPATVPVTR